MVNYLDLIGKAGKEVKNAGSSFFNYLRRMGNDTTSNTPDITPLQMAEDGSVDYAKSLALKNNTTPMTFKEKMLGREMTEDYQVTDPKTGNTEMATYTNYKPGLLEDISSGYRENRFAPTSLNNFGQNTLADGRQKGFGYRLGEGLGSIARFGESPLGRSLIVGGLVGANGGSALESLVYGGKAGLLNQQNRTADKIYRDDLIRSQQNALKNSPEFAKLEKDAQQGQLQDIADNINAQRGYINKDIYSNLINTQQLRDNADWKRFYFDAQQANLKEQQEWRKQQAEMQRQEAAANRAVQMRGQDLSYKLGQEKLQQPSSAELKEQRQLQQANKTINTIKAAYQAAADNTDAFGFWQGKAGADISNRIDTNGVKARSIVNSVTAEYRKYLTGAQMSDQERKEYYKFLPSPTDNSKIIKKKLEGMLTVIASREGVDIPDLSQLSPSTNMNINMDAVNAELAKRGIK